MNEIIEELIGFIIDIFFDASSEKTISRWIRYPIILILILFYAGITGFFVYSGINSLKTRPLISVLCFGVALYIVIDTVRKFIRIYGEKHDS